MYVHHVNRIWTGVAMQLHDMAVELAKECNVHARHVNIRSCWVEFNSPITGISYGDDGKTCWKMYWVATIATSPIASYSGEGRSPLTACEIALESFHEGQSGRKRSNLRLVRRDP